LNFLSKNLGLIGKFLKNLKENLKKLWKNQPRKKALKKSRGIFGKILEKFWENLEQINSWIFSRLKKSGNFGKTNSHKKGLEIS
jgi:hypothetical protein